MNRYIKVEFDMPKDLASFGYNPEMVIKLDPQRLEDLGWQATVDTEGKITSIQYNLAAQSTITNDAELARLSGNQLVCGSSVDALGIPYYQNQANEFIRTFTQAFNKFDKIFRDTLLEYLFFLLTK